MNAETKLRRSDLVGATVSGLCAVHCALAPLLYVVQPLLPTTPHAHGWASLDLLFLVLGLAAVWYSAGHSDRRWVSWALWVAWATLAVGVLLEPLGVAGSSALAYAGSGALLVVHGWSYRYCAPASMR